LLFPYIEPPETIIGIITEWGKPILQENGGYIIPEK